MANRFINALNILRGQSISPINSLSSYGIKEKTKTATILPEERFPADLGIKHPVSFADLERWYTDDAFVHGVIEKHVDFILGGGIGVSSKNENIKEFCAQKFKEFEFLTLLRDWIKRALVTGNGYIEIFYGKDGAPVSFNVLDSKYIYVKLKKKDGKLTNEVESYNQFVSMQTTPVPIALPEDSIAHLAVNTINDNPYGIGIIQPLTYALYKKNDLMNDMCMLVHKKAGTRMFIKVGSAEKGIVPKDSEMQAFGQRLETETGLTGFVVGPYTEPMIVDYGDIGKNFASPLEIIDGELIYGAQVPQVLMGTGNVAEGLATEQGKTWLYRIRSFQETIEKVIETKILNPLLTANGFNPLDADFEWGSVSPEEKRAEVTMYQSLLNSSMFLNRDFREQVEQRLRDLLEFTGQAQPMNVVPNPQMPPAKIERPVRKKEEPKIVPEDVDAE